jgi:hypothetical protein
MHLHGAGLAAFIVLAICAWAIAFIIYWALMGWGVSIAVRSYRWAMRNHRPKQGTPAVVEQTMESDSLPTMTTPATHASAWTKSW